MIGLIVGALVAMFLALGGAGYYEKVRADLAVSREATQRNRADVAESRLRVAEQRATDLALLWSGTLNRADEERRKQRETDEAQIAALQARVRDLSPRPSLHFSADAWRLWGDVAGRPDEPPAAPAAPAGTPARADPIPAATDSGADVSEQADVGWKVKARAAYDDCVGLLHGVRAAYDELRAAQPERKQP